MMLLAILLSLSSSAPSGQATVAVHVATEPERDGFADSDLKQRADSVRDLVKKLEKKKGLRLTQARDQADLVVELLGRDQRETGNEWRFGAETTKETAAVLRARLSVGSYTQEFLAKGDGRLLGEWSYVAGKLADQIAKWIELNRARLEERRRESVRDGARLPQ